jgi:regulator of cell morphogenesis and NO signaling
MKTGLFTENTKMADMLLANYRLLYVLPCFEIGLGFGEQSIKQTCQQNGIDTALLLLVCNLHTFETYRPDARTLAAIALEGLMKYLQNSHHEYLTVRLPAIISHILTLIDACRIYHGEILMKFCEKYRQQVVSHFEYEEKIVFPYIAALLAKKPADAYSIKEYENSHTNLNAALDDLKNIIIKYLPQECTIEKCRNVLVDLFLFESDMQKHAMLEDKILVSLVERIENNLK